MLAGNTDWVLDKVIGTEPAAARRKKRESIKRNKIKSKNKTGPDMGSFLENSIKEFSITLS